MSKRGKGFGALIKLDAKEEADTEDARRDAA